MLIYSSKTCPRVVVQFYMKTGDCKYGPRCKFNHPKDRKAALSDPTGQTKEEGVPGLQNGALIGPDGAATAGTGKGSASSGEKGSGKSMNSKGLPIRQVEILHSIEYQRSSECL